MNYIGNYAELRIDRFTSVGAYLSDDKEFEVLLPNKYLLPEWETNEVIRVFIYNDSEDRPVATTEIPLVELNQFAYLQVKAVNQFGAFLNWGLEKDLLVPYSEQNSKMEVDKHYLIYLYLDEKTNRLVGSAKINRFLKEDTSKLKISQQVELFIGPQTSLGRTVIIDSTYKGLIFNDRIIKNLSAGTREVGFIEFIRTDGKIDVSLVPIGNEKFDLNMEKIIKYLEEREGIGHLTDKSDPDLIRAELGMSKKSFKKAIGNLYKEKKILIQEETIQLIA